ncbi:hypothetical protein FRC17_003241 [Serendipita sp. 399]|nr:hypothetical protein FRC17_003241 [Serendipita sp. 399]
MKKSALYWYIHTLWVGWCYGQNRREHVFFFTEIQNTTIADSSGEWKPVDYTFEHGERPPMYSAVKGLLLLSFRAYMISIHISRPPGSSISVWLDGKQSNFPFVHEAESTLLNANSSFLDSRLDEMFVMDANLTSGDHQLLVDATGSEEHPVIFDRVEALTIGSSLVPTNYTTMASSLPAGTLVDDSDVLLRYSDSGWQRKEDPFCWENTLAVTSTPGSWLQVTFIGTGIWIYGVIPLEGTVVTIEALKKDGRETTRNTTMYNITRSDLDAPLYQAPLITQERLPYANAYAYNVTLISGSLQFDFMKSVELIDTICELAQPPMTESRETLFRTVPETSR